MNKRKMDLSGAELSRTIFIRFFITMIVFTLVLAVTFLGGIYICSQFTWHNYNPIYWLLKFIKNYSLPILALLWLAGFLLIFYYFWRKTLGYIDTIADASNLLVSTDEKLILLPAELKHVENRMNQAKQNAILNARLAKEAEQRKNDLVVYLAHDLKTPLTSVIGYLTLLRDEQKISEELKRKYLSISLDKAERLEDLINEFFEITRFNLSHLELEPGSVNLTRMLEQIADEFKPLLSAKSLQCTIQIAADMVIRCDVNKMERVFDNLIRNAINYSFENSTIGISAWQDNSGVYLFFRNHGNTIPPEKLKRIFEQFFRLDTSRSSSTGGAGLGLAIAKEIIELHHGTIAAASEKDIIEFKVFLPPLP